MSNTTFNARIKNKRDTAANWEQKNPILLNGEVILVDTNAGQLRSKIGDGVKTYTQLPFSDEVINAALVNKAEKTEAPLQIIITQTTQNSEIVLVANYKASEINSFVSTTGQLIYMFVPIYGHVIQATFLYYQDNIAYFSFVAYDGIYSVSINENKIVQVIRTYTYPTGLSNLTDDIGIANMNATLANKYDKTGGDISGNVKVFGNLTLDIDDEDYDSGITFSKALDTNLGTVLTLTGYADNTSYRPVIRNIHDPVNNYDAATKKYVDENLITPNYHIVFLNLDGTVDQTSVASTVIYSEISAHLTNRTQADYLDVFWDQTRFYAKCVEIIDINTGDLKFIGEVEFNGMQRYIVFTLTPQNVLTTTSIITFESISNKVTSIVNYPTSTTKYPTTKAVFDEFCRKPVVIWEVTDTSQGLNAIQANISANDVSWQLTNLDFTPYKRIKVYSKGGQGSTNAGTTGAMILEMSLDPRMAITSQGGHYVGSVLSQKPNDNNRYASLTCAVSADKTKFAVLRQTSLYGTAATTNNDIGASVVLIEGYYD